MTRHNKLRKIVCDGKGGPGFFGALAAPGNAILGAADSARAAYHENRKRNFDRQYDILSKARKSAGAGQFDASGKPTQGFMYQTLADEIKSRKNVI